MPLEIACFNLESVKEAVNAGADRIELCINRELGGLTPSWDDFTLAKSNARSIPINVMIRTRGGDFDYNNEEFEEMRQSLNHFNSLGADGFVFGILKAGNIDIERCQELVQLADGKPCTFHRAFDELLDMEAGLQDVAKCGFKAVLTSGGEHDAESGACQLRKLVDLSRHNETKLDVIVGGGVRSTNITKLHTTTGANWFHSSALLSDQNVISTDEVLKLKELLSSPS